MVLVFWCEAVEEIGIRKESLEIEVFSQQYMAMAWHLIILCSMRIRNTDTDTD
jgi:hypothetical protein